MIITILALLNVVKGRAQNSFWELSASCDATKFIYKDASYDSLGLNTPLTLGFSIAGSKHFKNFIGDLSIGGSIGFMNYRAIQILNVVDDEYESVKGESYNAFRARIEQDIFLINKKCKLLIGVGYEPYYTYDGFKAGSALSKIAFEKPISKKISVTLFAEIKYDFTSYKYRKYNFFQNGTPYNFYLRYSPLIYSSGLSIRFHKKK